MKGNNIWALFIQPEFENLGIGRQLREIMLDWYFTQTKNNVWLGTSPNTSAETFKGNRVEPKFEFTGNGK